MIRLKRVYDTASADDGVRILVERLWPRGMTKERAHVDRWLREIAPSAELRAWYAHDVANWDEFQRLYEAELACNPAVTELRDIVDRERVVTFVYAASDEEHNSARVLKAFLDRTTA